MRYEKPIHVEGFAENFVVTITGNAPMFIEHGLQQVVNDWLDKVGSTYYFTGYGAQPDNVKRKELKLSLSIKREVL